MHNFARLLAAFWLGGSLLTGGPAFAQAAAPATIATPAAAESPSDRLLREIGREIATVEPVLERYGYGAVFTAVGVEGFGIPAPGQTLLIAGALTATHKATLHIQVLLLVAFLAALAGSSLGYLIGRRGGRALLQRLRVNERHLQRIEQGFNRYGGGLIVIARFFDGPRQLNGIAAGILEMPWWTFTLFNAIGALLWVGCWGLGIYYLDEHLHAILAVVRRCNPWVATLTLAGVVGLILLLWRGYRARTGQGSGDHDRPAR